MGQNKLILKYTVIRNILRKGKKMNDLCPFTNHWIMTQQFILPHYIHLDHKELYSQAPYSGAKDNKPLITVIESSLNLPWTRTSIRNTAYPR